MTSECLQIFDLIISGIAVIGAVYVGLKQIAISNKQATISEKQAKIEESVYLMQKNTQVFANVISIPTGGALPELFYYDLALHNIGGQVVVLKKYTFNGAEILDVNQTIPPIYRVMGYQYPLGQLLNGLTNVTAYIFLENEDKEEFQIKINAQFVNGAWKLNQTQTSLPNDEKI